MDAFARVLAQPGSLAARRALAAQWRANGDPRAELIEKQLAHRDALAQGSATAFPLSEEVLALIAKHGKQWAGEIATLVLEYKFHRGLVAEVAVAGDQFLAVVPRLFAHAPIQHVRVRAPLGSFEAIVGSPHLARLSTLLVNKLGAAVGDAQAIALARSPYVANLRYIGLHGGAIGEAGVEALAASPHLERCIHIDLGRNPTNPTPQVSDYEGIYHASRPPLAEKLERAFGKRPWLSVPEGNLAGWPPYPDDLAVTP